MTDVQSHKAIPEEIKVLKVTRITLTFRPRVRAYFWLALIAPVKRISLVWSEAVTINEARIVLLFIKENKKSKKEKKNTIKGKMKYSLACNLENYVLNWIFLFKFRIPTRSFAFSG